MSRESSLWQWLAKARVAFKSDKLHMNRIENSAGPGMADVEGQLLNHGQFWLELKVADRPKRELTAVRFKVRPRQILWNALRWKTGGAAYWLLQVGSAEDRRLYLVPGFMGKEIAKGMPECDLAMAAVNEETSGRKIAPADIIVLALTDRNRYARNRLFKVAA